VTECIAPTTGQRGTIIYLYVPDNKALESKALERFLASLPPHQEINFLADKESQLKLTALTPRCERLSPFQWTSLMSPQFIAGRVRSLVDKSVSQPATNH
jgi:hypothetical protein